MVVILKFYVERVLFERVMPKGCFFAKIGVFMLKSCIATIGTAAVFCTITKQF